MNIKERLQEQTKEARCALDKLKTDSAQQWLAEFGLENKLEAAAAAGETFFEHKDQVWHFGGTHAYREKALKQWCEANGLIFVHSQYDGVSLVSGWKIHWG